MIENLLEGIDFIGRLRSFVKELVGIHQRLFGLLPLVCTLVGNGQGAVGCNLSVDGLYLFSLFDRFLGLVLSVFVAVGIDVTLNHDVFDPEVHGPVLASLGNRQSVVGIVVYAIYL